MDENVLVVRNERLNTTLIVIDDRIFPFGYHNNPAQLVDSLKHHQDRYAWANLEMYKEDLLKKGWEKWTPTS